MSVTKQGLRAAFAATILLLGAQLTAPAAFADPPVAPGTDQPAPPVDDAAPSEPPVFGPGPHNVVYRARVDGVSRGAAITYKMTDDEFNTAVPTMVPGRVFEATGVVSQPQDAGMQLSIQWPYSASLHCEILVDDQLTAQADQFVAPRFTPQHNDPGYGVLSCGTVTNFPTGNTAPIDALPPEEPAPAAAEPAAPVT